MIDPSHPLPQESFGRERELSRLLQELTEAQRLGSVPRVCFVRGSAGIGKTFVLDLLARAAREQGARVFSAQPRTRRAYGLFEELVPTLIRSLSESGTPDRELLDLTRRTAPVTGRAARPDDTRTNEERKLDLFDAVAEVFALAGRDAAPVILIDDLHAADGASLDLLRYVLVTQTTPGQGAVATTSSRALWVLALDDDADPPAPLRELLARVPARSVPLAGLDADGLKALLERRATVERILDTTGGVPERIEALLSHGELAPADELYRRRFDQLDPGDRWVLCALAAIGRPVEPALVTDVLRRIDKGPSAVASCLDRLVGQRFVAAEYASRDPRFELLRSAECATIQGSLEPSDRVLLHAALGAAMAEAPGHDAAEVARHLRISDPEGAGYEWSVRAGEALTARLAYHDAIEAYTNALEVLPERHGARAADLCQRLFELHLGMADYARAMHWLGRVKGSVRGDPEALREVRGRAARVCLSMGRPALAERLCDAVLAGGADDAVAMAAHSDLAEAAWAQGHYSDALDRAQRALEGLDGSDTGTRAQLSLRNTMGKVFLHRAEYDQAEVLFSRNVVAAASLSSPREEAKAHNNLGVVAQRQGNRRAALEHYRRSLALRQGVGDRSREAFALQNIAALYHETGEFEKALDHYHRALASFTRAGNATQVARTACNLANLYVFLGDIDRATSLCDHALAVADEVRDPYLQGYAKMIRGDILGATDDRSGARATYREALAEFIRIESPRYALEVRLSLAQLVAEGGELRAAREILDEVGAILSDQQFAGLAGPYQLTTAEVALAAGDLEQATRALSRAKEIYLDAPDLEGPVRLYYLLGKLREAFGDSDGSELNLARSQRLLDELASRVPVSHRTLFLSVSRRRQVQDALSGREITPDRLRAALALEPDAPAGPARSAQSGVPGIIGRDPKLLRVLSLIDRIGQVTSPVLIRGASGTGKELVAQAIQQRSGRADAPFVKVNCGAIHDELLLSELFGHEKGAFTGAVKERQGRFEAAHGGTLFLDEIGDISPKAQVALLRVLQNGEFERVGGTKTLAVDVRVICATNRNLEEMIEAGTFREDLYYRLKGATLELPPLRDRPGDIPVLMEHFLHRIAVERDEPVKKVSPEVMTVLAAHSWPGNIREMENVAQSLALFATGDTIEYADLEHHPELLEGRETPAHVVPTTAVTREQDFFDFARDRGLSLKDLKREVERQCIRRALSEAEGNISEAARLLGMKRSRLSQIVNADDDLKSLSRIRTAP